MNPELMRRAVVTLAALLVYRIGTYVPLPGIDPAVWEMIFKSQAGGLLGSFNVFAGGGIARMAVLALSLIPYMTAAWFVQLLVLFWPRLRALGERGDKGRRKIQQYVLGLTLLLAVLQSYGIAQGLEGAGNVVTNPGLFFRIAVVVTLTGGTFFLIWLSELISVRGLGNGLALILSVGILTQIPAGIAGMLELQRQGIFSDSVVAGVAIFAVVLIGFIAFMEMARRHVPVEYARRQIGNRMIEAHTSTLAFKLNVAGAIPAIYAGWLLSVFVVVAGLLFSLSSIAAYLMTGSQDPRWFWLFGWFAPGQPAHMIYTLIAVVVISLLYAALLIDPDHVAEKLKRYGSVIAGIEPGEATAAYLDKVLSRTTLLGGAYTAFVVVAPEVLSAYANLPFYLSGVSALTIVCTVLDIQAQIRGQERISLRERRA
jgi:preprotein translocase subunit SecY